MDGQKAFDKQDHKLYTLCELYSQGADGGMWSVASDLYEGLTSKVKWQGEFSGSVTHFQFCWVSAQLWYCLSILVLLDFSGTNFPPGAPPTGEV